MQAQFQKKAQSYKEAKQEYEKQSSLINLLRQSFEMRIELEIALRKYNAARAGMIFSTLLTRRGYIGKMETSHTKRTLEVHVSTTKKEVEEHSEGRDAKTLSGGEKSFSQICFMLALWEAIHVPFRALDEFDVFMVRRLLFFDPG